VIRNVTIISVTMTTRKIRATALGPPLKSGRFKPSPPPVRLPHDEITSRTTSTIAIEPMAK
jgi:hypothetical protein